MLRCGISSGSRPSQVAVDGAQHGLVADHQDGPLLALELEHHRLDALDHVHVALALWVAIAELVARARLPLLGKALA